MTADGTRSAGDELQFDRVVPTSPAPAPVDERPTVACDFCSTPIHDSYYHVNGKAACERCRGTATAAMSVPKGWRPMAKAIGLGVLAAIAGAVIYYGVIEITQFEIGIVAILIGWMVGWAVRKGAGGRGGRRFQIAAVILTYCSVGLAYAPITFGMHVNGAATKAGESVDSLRVQATDSVPASATGANATSVAAKSGSDGSSVLVGLGALLLVIVALPVMSVVDAGTSGLISAFIIFIGLRQAWRMTGAPVLNLSGPYRVGARAATERA